MIFKCNGEIYVAICMSPAICEIRQTVEFFTNFSILSKSESFFLDFSIDLCLKLNSLHDGIFFTHFFLFTLVKFFEE
jgi:hypothetical protein